MSISSVTSRTRTRLAHPLLALALAVVATSCGSDNPLGIANSWTLQTVGGVALPDTVPNTAHELVITSAIAILGNDGKYTMTYTGTTDGTPGQVASDNGTWTIESSTFIFTSAPLHGSTYIAALVRGTFKADVPGALFGSSTNTFSMVFSSTP